VARTVKKQTIAALWAVLTIGASLLVFGIQTSNAQSTVKVSGYVMDSLNRGVSGSRVILYSQPTGVSAGAYTPGPNGYYEIHVPANTYSFSVFPPVDSNYVSYDQYGFVVGNTDTTKNITLSLGYKISGYVVDSSDRPLNNILVYLNQNISGYNTDYLSGYGTDDSGYYYVSAPSGTYNLKARDQGGTNLIDTEVNFVVGSDTIKNIVFENLISSKPRPTGSTVKVQSDNRNGGQASLTTEKTHNSPHAVKLAIPSNTSQAAWAVTLYAYGAQFKSISTFAVDTSFTNATPRFLVYLDKNNDGVLDSILVSTHPMAGTGAWTTLMGGNSLGWSEAAYPSLSYGSIWKSLDGWKADYGNGTVKFLGIGLDYGTNYLNVPVYADELIVNGQAYFIWPGPSVYPTPAPTTPAPTLSPTPIPTPTPLLSSTPKPSTTPTPTPYRTPGNTPPPLTPTPAPTPFKTPTPTPSPTPKTTPNPTPTNTPSPPPTPTEEPTPAETQPTPEATIGSSQSGTQTSNQTAGYIIAAAMVTIIAVVIVLMLKITKKSKN
jgi:hypothetical protein